MPAPIRCRPRTNSLDQISAFTPIATSISPASASPISTSAIAPGADGVATGAASPLNVRHAAVIAASAERSRSNRRCATNAPATGTQPIGASAAVTGNSAHSAVVSRIEKATTAK